MPPPHHSKSTERKMALTQLRQAMVNTDMADEMRAVLDAEPIYATAENETTTGRLVGQLEVIKERCECDVTDLEAQIEILALQVADKKEAIRRIKAALVDPKPRSKPKQKPKRQRKAVPKLPLAKRDDGESMGESTGAEPETGTAAEQ